MAKTTVKRAVKRTPRVNKTLHNKKALLEALEKSLGVVTTACKSVGLTRKTFYDYYNADDDFRNAVDDVENIALDFAESQLHKQIRDGIPVSTIFYLKTKGKKRGYIEKSEHELSNKQGESFRIDASITDTERVERITAILDKGRTRRNRRADK